MIVPARAGSGTSRSARGGGRGYDAEWRSGDQGHREGGSSPDVIVVKQSQHVRLDFYRDERASCSEQVVFGHFGIARLPAFKTTSINFTPDKSGEFTFACGMNMMRGRLVVEG